MQSVLSLAARRTCVAAVTPKWRAAPVSLKRIGLTRSHLRWYCDCSMGIE